MRWIGIADLSKHSESSEFARKEYRGALRGAPSAMDNSDASMVTDDMLSGLVSHFNGTVEIVPRESVRRQDVKDSRRQGRPPASKSRRLQDAKAELMRRYGVSEPLAHRSLQRLAMDCRIEFDEVADIIRLGLMAMDHLRADTDGQTEE